MHGRNETIQCLLVQGHYSKQKVKHEMCEDNAHISTFDIRITLIAYL